MTTNQLKRRYRKQKYGKENSMIRTAKCGHLSKQGRYFKCENCQPTLPEDNGDWDYFNLDDSDFDSMEE